MISKQALTFTCRTLPVSHITLIIRWPQHVHTSNHKNLCFNFSPAFFTKARGSHSTVAEDSSLLACYPVLTGKYVVTKVLTDHSAFILQGQSVQEAWLIWLFDLDDKGMQFHQNINCGNQHGLTYQKTWIFTIELCLYYYSYCYALLLCIFVLHIRIHKNENFVMGHPLLHTRYGKTCIMNRFSIKQMYRNMTYTDAATCYKQISSTGQWHDKTGLNKV
jgi:hypothetical protein